MTDRATSELIHDYFSDRLGSEERAMIETRIVTDPAFRREYELAESMRAGFRELERGGELAGLLAGGRSAHTYRNWAIAAGIVAGALLLSSALLYRELQASRSQLTAGSRGTIDIAAAIPAGTERIVFERLRSVEAVTELRLLAVPALLTLQFDVGLEPHPAYAVTVARLAGDSAVLVLEVPATATGSDGLVSLTVHSALLSPGEYQVRLAPAAEVAAEPASIDYRFRVAN